MCFLLMRLAFDINDVLSNMQYSHIKIGLIIISHVLLLNLVLGVEDHVVVGVFLLEKIEGFLFHWVRVHQHEAVVHPRGQVLVLLDCHRFLLLHYLLLAVLLLGWLAVHKKVVHLFLFFSSILHSLKVPSEHRRPPRSNCARKVDGLYLIWGNIV